MYNRGGDCRGGRRAGAGGTSAREEEEMGPEQELRQEQGAGACPTDAAQAPGAPAASARLRVVLGSDHAGYGLKRFLAKELAALGYVVTDCGCDGAEQSVDYPDYAEKACREVLAGRADRAVLVCGTGIGISIAANKLPGIRCAHATHEVEATLSRRHNDANAVALGARIVGEVLALEIARAFLETAFEGGRHQRRVDKITCLERRAE